MRLVTLGAIALFNKTSLTFSGGKNYKKLKMLITIVYCKNQYHQAKLLMIFQLVFVKILKHEKNNCLTKKKQKNYTVRF